MYSFLLFALCLMFSGCGKTTPDCGAHSIGRDPTWFALHLESLSPNLTAFTTALIQEISREEDFPIRIVNIDWTHLINSLERNQVEGILTSLLPNVMTLEKYSFSDPLVLLGPVLIVPIHSQITSLADLTGKIVGVNQFDDSTLIVQRYPSIIIKPYQNLVQALDDLNTGLTDGVLMPVLDAQGIIPSLYSTTLKIVTEPLDNVAVYLITLKESSSTLIDHFNKGLEKARSSGKYRELRQNFQLY